MYVIIILYILYIHIDTQIGYGYIELYTLTIITYTRWCASWLSLFLIITRVRGSYIYIYSEWAL